MAQTPLRILMAGSVDPNASPAERSIFERACETLTSEIIKRGHTPVVTSERPGTVDQFVHAALAKMGTSCPLTVFCHSLKPHPFLGAPAPNIKYDRKTVPHHWASGKIPVIKYCDVAIIIGGQQKTGQIAHLAPLSGKPYVPIPAFKGVAAAFWPPVADYYSENGIECAQRSEIETWSDTSSPNAVLDLAEALAAASPFVPAHNSKILFFSIASVPILTLVWFLLFFVFAKSCPVTALGGCVLSAWLVGAGARILWGARARNWEELCHSYVSSLVTVFGLTIMYMILGFTIVGDMSFVEPTEKSIRKLCVSLTVLAFASGLWSEEMRAKMERGIKHHEIT